MGTLTSGSGAGVITVGGSGILSFTPNSSVNLTSWEDSSDFGSVTINVAGGAYPSEVILSAQPAVISISEPAYLVASAITGLETEIVKITDETEIGGAYRTYRHLYAKRSPWNSDGTRIALFFRGTADVPILNGTTFEHLSNTNFAFYSETLWSRTAPNVVYGVAEDTPNVCQMTAITLNTTTGAFQSLRYFGPGGTNQSFPDLTSISIGPGEGNFSDDGSRVVITGDIGASGIRVIVFDMVGETIVSSKDFAGASISGGQMDWASISRSGDYVVCSWHSVAAGAPIYQIYDAATMTLQRTWDVGGQGHADFAYDMNGHEVLVTVDSSLQMKTFRLSDGTVTAQLTAGHMASNFHISGRCFDRDGYVYVSTFSDAGTGATEDFRVMWREVFALKLDGTGTIERFAQNFGHEDAVDELYARQTQACPNADGTIILMASDFGDGTNTAIIHTYAVGMDVLP